MIFLFLLLIVLPIAEMFVLLKAGGAFGALPVIAAVVATALIGGAIIRWQGLQALHKLRQSTGNGEAPIEPVVDGFFLLICTLFDDTGLYNRRFRIFAARAAISPCHRA